MCEQMFAEYNEETAVAYSVEFFMICLMLRLNYYLPPGFINKELCDGLLQYLVSRKMAHFDKATGLYYLTKL